MSASATGGAVPFPVLLGKTVVIHTVTYFLVGIMAFTVFDYGTHFASPELAGLMRQTDDPLVRAGPLFQPIRGVLFALAFYPLREVVFGRPRGWLAMWAVLVLVGIFSTFGPAPGSVEGLIYTRLPLGLQLGGLVEVLLQSLLLSVGLFLWVRHPGRRWLNGVLVAAFLVVMALPALGLLALGLGAAP